MTLTVGSMFSGCGGMDLGLERAGMRVVWQAETDRFASEVLSKRWPGVPNLGDVTRINWLGETEALADGTFRFLHPAQTPDVLAAGFPCQDISNAGRRAGITGSQSRLFFEVVRAIRTLRPRIVLLENVAALLSRGLGVVLGSLAACGYDAEWDCLPAVAVGAHHIRDRIFVVAKRSEGERASRTNCEPTAAHANRNGRHTRRESDAAQGPRGRKSDRSGVEPVVSDADCGRLSIERQSEHAEQQGSSGDQSHRRGALRRRQGSAVPDAHQPRREGWCLGGERARELLAGARGRAIAGIWRAEPELGRVAHGVPRRVDRLRVLGSAVVPQVAQLLGELILAAEVSHG